MASLKVKKSATQSINNNLKRQQYNNTHQIGAPEIPFENNFNVVNNQ